MRAGKYFSIDASVGYSMVDANATLSPSAIVTLLQDTGAIHSEHVGCGLDYQGAMNAGWVVIEYNIKIKRLPKMAEKIKVITGTYMMKGVFGGRRYFIEDENGDEIIEVDSLWVMGSVETGKPIRVPEEMGVRYGMVEKPEGDWPSSKLRPADGLEEIMTFVVPQMFIDTNEHMNNVYYPKVVESFIPENFTPANIVINYKDSLRLGDEATIKRVTTEDICQFVIYKEDKVSAIVELRK